MQRETNPAIIAIAVVVVVAIVAALGYKFLGPNAKPVDTRVNNPAYQEYQKTGKYPTGEKPGGGPGAGSGGPGQGSPGNGSPSSGGQ